MPERLTDAPEVVRADVAPVDAGGGYPLATLDPSFSPITTAIYGVLDRDGVVLLPPVTERTGSDEVRVVGEAAAVGELARSLPPAIDIDVREIGQGALVHEHPAATLSDRQREAVRVALDRGYYAQPRRTTHEAIGEELGCAPSTASEHLRKSESKLVRSVMGPGPG